MSAALPRIGLGAGLISQQSSIHPTSCRSFNPPSSNYPHFLALRLPADMNNSDGNPKATTKPTKKRLRDPNDEIALPDECAPSAKRAKTATSDISQPLNAEALKRHTLHEGHITTLELMDSENHRGNGRKRSKRSASQADSRPFHRSPSNLHRLPTTATPF